MKIAIVSKLWEETSPTSRGGTGASVGTLVNELVARGHKITLFASGNSATRAQELSAVRPRPYRQGQYSEIHEYENIAAAFRRHREFDLIHCAVEQKSVLFGDLTTTPSLHSIRYAEFFAHEINLLKKYRRLNFVANSRSVIKELPWLNWRGFVYNGLDLSLFPFSAKEQGYLLFLARMSPQKGVDLAIKIARQLKLKLILAGKKVPTDNKFLADKVTPFIDNKNIIYLGEVGFKKKVSLLKNASALLQFSRLPEACSNTILEAMACGTPVIALNNGSNKELIKHGRVGFVVKKPAQIIAAIKKIPSLRRIECRRHIEKHFSQDEMVDGYEKVYKQLITKRY